MKRNDVSVSGRGTAVSAADPYHCPDCGALLVNAGGVGCCPGCGFSWADPLAGRVWEIDNDLVGLREERRDLIEQMRLDRRGSAAPAVLPGAPPMLVKHRRSVSVPALLVGLGALLLVVAGVVFAAVTWSRLGAAGQAAVLAVATATATTVALVAARRKLTATAEALALVAAGFALVDVHALRVAVASGNDWQIVWAVGLILVAVGLVVLGRAGSLRGPPLIAVLAAQLPLVLLASMADRPLPIAASALIFTAAADHVVATRIRRSPVTWLPDPVSLVLRILGTIAWVVATWAALPLALGLANEDVTTAERWWAEAVIIVAAVEAVVLARVGRPRARLAVAAAAASVLTGLVAVLALAAIIGLSGNALLLVATGSSAALLAVSLLAVRNEAVAVDLRARGAQITAGTWAVISVLGFSVSVIGSLAIPFVVLAEDGWWTRGPGVTTGDLDPPANLVVAGPNGWSTAALLAAVGIGTIALVVAVLAIIRPIGPARRMSVGSLVGFGCFAGIAVAGVRLDVAVAALISVYLLVTVVLVIAPVWPGRRLRPWAVVAAVPLVASAVAWAGSVDMFTVVTLGLLAVLGGLAVARGIVEPHRTWTICMTVVTGVAISVTALTVALTAGATDAQAWIVTVAVATCTSGFAAVADRWAPWWSLAVDLTSSALVVAALVGLALSGGPDSFSIGLGIVALVAAAHVWRPSRRVIAATIAAIAGLCLLSLRLWESGVRAVEAYALPAAALLLAAGWWQLRRNESLGSWPALGPGLVVAAVPSVVMAVTESDVIRALVVLGVAVIVTVIGAVRRLRAPLVVGSATAVVIAVDQLFPMAARLPRWIGIGTAGVLLLVIGTTFEWQRRHVVNLYHRYSDLR